MPPRVSMTMIARDEAHNVEACFASFWPHVDEVVLVDTGSQDGTPEVARRFAEEKGEPDKLVLGEFDWCDDFAAARNHADSLATGDWLVWCDLDDRIHGAEHLRRLAAEAPPDAAGYLLAYAYRFDGAGQVIWSQPYDRLMRRSATGPWESPVWESRKHDGELVKVPTETIEWRHTRPADTIGSSIARNRRIALKWARNEPEDPKLLHLLACCVAVDRGVAAGIPWLHRYLAAMGDEWDFRRLQVHRQLALTLLGEGRVEEAVEVAQEALHGCPEEPTDALLTLAEAAYFKGNWLTLIPLAREVIRRGQPLTPQGGDPSEYSEWPQEMLDKAVEQLSRESLRRMRSRRTLQRPWPVVSRVGSVNVDPYPIVPRRSRLD